MKKKNVTFCLSEDVVKDLKALATQEKRSMSQMVEVLIQDSANGFGINPLIQFRVGHGFIRDIYYMLVNNNLVDLGDNEEVAISMAKKYITDFLGSRFMPEKFIFNSDGTM
jgi:hypothetical protein